jgi:hypothetical protein
LQDAFGNQTSYQVMGEPVSLPDAEALARQDPYQFQWWALGLVGARPVEQRRGADQGIDGRLYFHDEGRRGRTKQIILSVKSGHVSVTDIRELQAVRAREQAEIGVLLTLRQPTQPMKAEAASAGFYTSPWGRHSRLQMLTVRELLQERRIDYPQAVNITFRRAPQAEANEVENFLLPLAAEDSPPYEETRIHPSRASRRRYTSP